MFLLVFWCRFVGVAVCGVGQCSGWSYCFWWFYFDYVACLSDRAVRVDGGCQDYLDPVGLVVGIVLF